MKRLYLQFYLTIVASLLLVVLIAGALWRLDVAATPASQAYAMAGELVALALAPADAPPAEQQQALARVASRLHTDATLFAPGGAPIASVGRPVPAPDGRRDGGWLFGPSGTAWALKLPDDRRLVVRVATSHSHPAVGLVMFLGCIALAVGIGAFPVVRQLTRRLERLQAGVESLGAGDLAARVKVEGRDDVARLATSFNAAAARIESLVGAHRMLLANASHELRTPLARIRLGIELATGQVDASRKAALEADIVELDQLIDEILLASRLDAVADLEVDEEIDLLALVAEECARYDHCALTGTAVLVRGDPRLLRRMIRNLLENAAHHGRPPIAVAVKARDGQAVLEVCDAGPGIAAAEQAGLFEPFHRIAGTGRTGLGLALVRQIARRHRGDVSYGGDAPSSCFTVVLPTTR
ncbi:MAG TPA: ATP-binding protein [Xanthobacteraceae bacterium]|nr:ATP-binding protein [Xanthobacteraceae bacterium]